MVEATGRGCPVDTSVHSTEAPTEAAAENGCPVDTSVRSTEAPTEAAAETLKPWNSYFKSLIFQLNPYKKQTQQSFDY